MHQPNQPSIAQLEQAAAQGHPVAAVQLGQRLISTSAPGTSACERGLGILREASAGPQAPGARWLLSAFYLHNLSQSDGLSNAVHWLKQAAESKVGLAIDRMANFYLRGVGVDYEPKRTLQLLEQLADAGFLNAAWEVGYISSTVEEVLDAHNAMTAFTRACALGYLPAYYLSLIHI